MSVIFFPSHPFLHPIPYGLGNVAEVPIAEVETEFLDASAHLHPGAHPPHDAIDTLPVRKMLYDMDRMLERDSSIGVVGIHLKPLHSEDTPITTRQCLQCAAKMSTVLSGTQIIHEIVFRRNTQAIAQ